MGAVVLRPWDVPLAALAARREPVRDEAAARVALRALRGGAAVQVVLAVRVALPDAVQVRVAAPAGT